MNLGGDTKSTRIFCMGVHNILSVGGTKYPWGVRYILGYFVGGGYNILGGTKYPVTPALSQGLWVLDSNSATSCLALCVFELNEGS